VKWIGAKTKEFFTKFSDNNKSKIEFSKRPGNSPIIKGRRKINFYLAP